MSYVTLYAFDEHGDARWIGEARNNHAFAPLVWNKLAAQYKVPTTLFNPEPLWKLFDTDTLAQQDRLLLGMTFDRVWIRRELVPACIEAMRAFHKRYVAPGDLVPTIAESADILQTWYDESPSDRGVAFNLCSANASYWSVWEEEKDESRPYNIDKDTTNERAQPGTHWELGEGLKAPA